mmetsp:Transcript_94786/g.267604  ORF Transcript_94786/g.267604 Transcript_94786/m.267604 type:complete len:207 (+) Transcript_94786:353-973(+)
MISEEFSLQMEPPMMRMTTFEQPSAPTIFFRRSSGVISPLTGPVFGATRSTALTSSVSVHTCSKTVTVVPSTKANLKSVPATTCVCTPVGLPSSARSSPNFCASGFAAAFSSVETSSGVSGASVQPPRTSAGFSSGDAAGAAGGAAGAGAEGDAGGDAEGRFGELEGDTAPGVEASVCTLPAWMYVVASASSTMSARHSSASRLLK